ncbi:hypothetical protein D1872_215540 [compost metagenome]
MISAVGKTVEEADGDEDAVVSLEEDESLLSALSFLSFLLLLLLSLLLISPVPAFPFTFTTCI